MINVSEHCNRPLDMFMFLGKYFEKTILETKQVEDTITGYGEGKVLYGNEQSMYFITKSIIDSFGTACKQYVQASR